MDTLIIYGTGEGHTGKIADFCSAHLIEAGHRCEVKNSVQRMADLDISRYDSVILAGSVHQKRHQESLETLAVAHREQLQRVPCLFLSVSLSIAFENGEAEARQYVRGFVENTGFEPNSVILVAGALRFDQYGYYMSQIVEHVVLKGHEEIKEDREFTDWKLLARELDSFVASC